jgi:predicted HAD superfamily phosphohydrolase YqeG
VLDRVRDVVGEEIEFVWRDEKPAKEALDTAMRRLDERTLPGRDER